MKILIISSVLIILLIIASMLMGNKTAEHFHWDPLWAGHNSLDCYNETVDSCLNYSNCGLCLNGRNKPQCMPGDVDGPLFSEICPSKWMHTNYTDRQAFGEKDTAIVPAFNYYYPEYEVMYPSTATMFQL